MGAFSDYIEAKHDEEVRRWKDREALKIMERIGARQFIINATGVDYYTCGDMDAETFLNIFPIISKE